MTGDICLYTDHLAIVRVLANDPLLLRAGTYENSDLWLEIAERLQAPGAHKLHAYWCNSHPDEDPGDIGYNPAVPAWAYAGNALADDAARVAAKGHSVPDAVAQQQRDLDEMALLVLERLVFLAKEAVLAQPVLPGSVRKRTPRERVVIPLVQQIADAGLHTSHRVVQLASGAMHCCKCLARSSAQNKLQVKFLDTPCGHIQSVNSIAASIPHASHHLSSRTSGLVWCVRCGSWSWKRYRALREPCDGTPHIALQEMCLRRLASGGNPPGDDFVAGKVKHIQDPTFSKLQVLGLDSDSSDEGR